MEDYLLCHAAFVTPVAFACYYTDGDLKRIKNDKAYLNQICASDHALNAAEEMSALNEGLKEFFEAHQADCPTYLKLERDAKKYIS